MCFLVVVGGDCHTFSVKYRFRLQSNALHAPCMQQCQPQMARMAAGELYSVNSAVARGHRSNPDEITVKVFRGMSEQ